MTALRLRPASLDAVVSFYALIHVPLADQQALFPRIRGWLRPGGYLQATVGAHRWTGTEPYLGASMFWDLVMKAFVRRHETCSGPDRSRPTCKIQELMPSCAPRTDDASSAHWNGSDRRGLAMLTPTR